MYACEYEHSLTDFYKTPRIPRIVHVGTIPHKTITTQPNIKMFIHALTNESTKANKVNYKYTRLFTINMLKYFKKTD